jgi:hypothetical protein
MMSKSFIGLALAAMALSPAVLQGCSSSGSNPLCCTEFKVGAEVDVNIGGSVQSQVAVQAIADIGGIGSAAIDDLTTACRNIAQDLDAPQADLDAAAANADKNAAMKAYCAAAVKVIGTAKGQASLQVTAKPPVCEASVSAKLDCQAKCSGGVKCDFKANPPKCTGGTLSIQCKGDCTASAGAQVSCTGSCSGGCTGSCTAQGGVDCQGKCEGTCEAKAGVAGSGAQADGTCKGTCKGTCSVTPPGVTCTGSCDGKCDAKCQGSATASVKCDGTCAADYEPVSCSGGKLEGGCTADAKCDANCNGSVQAKAQCTPPSIDIAFTGDAKFAGKLIATLKANLPKIFELTAKFSALADATGSLSANISAVTDIKAACIPPLVAAAAQAVSDIGDSVSATGSITASVK